MPVTEAGNTFIGNLVSGVENLDDTKLIAAAPEVEREDYTVIVDIPLMETL